MLNLNEIRSKSSLLSHGGVIIYPDTFEILNHDKFIVEPLTTAWVVL